MQTNDHKIRDYSASLNAQYGAPGTPERAKFEEEASALFCRVLIHPLVKKTIHNTSLCHNG